MLVASPASHVGRLLVPVDDGLVGHVAWGGLGSIAIGSAVLLVTAISVGIFLLSVLVGLIGRQNGSSLLPVLIGCTDWSLLAVIIWFDRVLAS